MINNRDKLVGLDFRRQVRILLVDFVNTAHSIVLDIPQIDVSGSISTPLFLRDFIVLSISHPSCRDIYSIDLQRTTSDVFVSHLRIGAPVKFDVTSIPRWTDRYIEGILVNGPADHDSCEIQLSDLALRKTVSESYGLSTINLDSVEEGTGQAPSTGSVLVPYTFFHKVGLSFPAPLIVTAYGAYGRSNSVFPDPVIMLSIVVIAL